MKKADLRDILKYLYLFLADIAFLISVVIIGALFGNIAYSFLFSYAEVYLILGIPLYLLLRGVLSRILLKRAWLPNFLFFAEVWLGSPIISLEFRFDLIFSLEGLMFATVLSLIPTIASLITGGILRLIRLLKRHKGE